MAIIPARGGSKGIPNKNIRPLNGKPLISYSIQPAVASKYINRIIVSTDSPQIAEIALSFHAEVPFLRPAELATDKADLRAALEDCYDRLYDSEGYEADIIVVMFPTYPFKTSRDLDRLLADIILNRAECSQFCNPIDNTYFDEIMILQGDHSLKPLAFKGDVKRFNWFFSNNSVLTRWMPPWRILRSLSNRLERDKTISEYFYEKRKEGTLTGKSIKNFVGPIRAIDINLPDDLELAEMVTRENIFNFESVFYEDRL